MSNLLFYKSTLVFYVFFCFSIHSPAFTNSYNLLVYPRSDIPSLGEDALDIYIKSLGKDGIASRIEESIGKHVQLENIIKIIERQNIDILMDAVDYENLLPNISKSLKILPAQPDWFLFHKIEKPVNKIGWIRIYAKVVDLNTSLISQASFEIPTGFLSTHFDQKIDELVQKLFAKTIRTEKPCRKPNLPILPICYETKPYRFLLGESLGLVGMTGGILLLDYGLDKWREAPSSYVENQGRNIAIVGGSLALLSSVLFLNRYLVKRKSKKSKPYYSLAISESILLPGGGQIYPGSSLIIYF